MSASRKSAPTVVTVVGGETRAPTRSFPLGNSVSGFSVGAEADWVIVAAGVERIHLYLGFDGRDVQVAPAAPTARVFLDARELGPGWHVAPVGCELRFGGVSLLVTNEEVRGSTQPLLPALRPSEPAPSRGPIRTQILTVPALRSEPPPPAEGSRPPLAGFAPVQPAPHLQGARAPQAVQPAGGGWAPTPPLNATAQWHTPAGAMASLAASAPPADDRAIQAPPPAANLPKIQPAPVVPLRDMDRTVVSPAAREQVTAPLEVPPAVQVLASSPPAMPVLAPAEAPPPVPGASVAARFSSAANDSDPLGPNTIGDGGALRAHAARVAEATPSAALTLAQEYADQVRRASAPTPVPAAGRPAEPNVRPGPPPVRAPNVPAPEAPGAASRFSLAASWRAASLPKKLTLVLLPFALAGVVVIFDDPPAPAPARLKKVASAAPSASALATTSASAVAASSALAPRVSGSSPPAVLSVARPSASAPPAAGPTSSVGASIIEVGSAAASSAAAPRPLYAAAERDALNAAFEGRNAEAARLYERLSRASEGKVFALAAKLVSENIVLKPAISH